MALAIAAWFFALTAVDASRGTGARTLPVLVFGSLSVCASALAVRAVAGFVTLGGTSLKLGYLTRTVVVSLDDVSLFSEGTWLGWNVVRVSIGNDAPKTLPLMAQPPSARVSRVVQELNECLNALREQG
jgi:hypothetical protein